MNQALDLCALYFTKSKFAKVGTYVAAIHGPISDPCFVTNRQIVDCLFRKLVESHFFSVKRDSESAVSELQFNLGKLVIKMSVT